MRGFKRSPVSSILVLLADPPSESFLQNFPAPTHAMLCGQAHSLTSVLNTLNGSQLPLRQGPRESLVWGPSHLALITSAIALLSFKCAVLQPPEWRSLSRACSPLFWALL